MKVYISMTNGEMTTLFGVGAILESGDLLHFTPTATTIVQSQYTKEGDQKWYYSTSCQLLNSKIRSLEVDYD